MHFTLKSAVVLYLIHNPC